MSKAYSLDDKVPTFYGEEDFTFREALEKGDLKVSCENNLETGFKPRYFVKRGFFKIRVNGNQAKKYLQKGEKL